MSDEFEEVLKKNFPHLYGAAKAGEPEANADMSNARWGWHAAKKHTAPPTFEYRNMPKVVCTNCYLIVGGLIGSLLTLGVLWLR